MSEELVNVVHLRAHDNTAVDRVLDLNPSKLSIDRLLGLDRRLSFLGQFPGTDTIIVHREQQNGGGDETGPCCKLPPPFGDHHGVVGDMVLVNMDDHAVPYDFTLQQYQQLFE